MVNFFLNGYLLLNVNDKEIISCNYIIIICVQNEKYKIFKSF